MTDRGQPRHVLLDIEHYRRLAGARRSIADAPSMPDAEPIDFEPPRAALGLQDVDLD